MRKNFKVTGRDVLSRSEVMDLFMCCKTLEEILFLRLGIYGGLRISEILALRPENVVFDGRRTVLRIRDSKGGKSRFACIDMGTASLLLATSYPWFKNKSDRSYQLMIKRLCKRAGIQDKNVSPHTLRHTNITMLLSRGMAIEKVQVHAGHESIATTLIYTHLVYDPIAREYEDAVGY